MLIDRLVQHLKELDRQAQELEGEIELWHRSSEVSKRLEAIPGIGPITASALVASAGGARNFQNALQFAACLGLVPRQNSSGGKTQLLGIGKRGDVYLRTLLIHGGRAVVQHAKTQVDQAASWLGRLIGRRHANVAAVAVADKNARIAYALLATGQTLHRYEHAAPGDMLPIDIKKLGRVERPSHRVTGNRGDSVDGAGWETLFVAIDDHARVAFTALHTDEKAPQASGFSTTWWRTTSAWV